MFAGESLSSQLTSEDIGEEIYALAAKIYPICRSITGNGVRHTLRELNTHIALDIDEVPTGTPVFDWTVPREWNIRDAYIKDARGEKIVDFANSNLHVMSYSVPVRRQISLNELKGHVHTLPDQPDLIPYRTSYYAENWAFCMAHRQFENLRDETYEVLIDSSLADGYLTYGEYLHKGETEDEFLFSAHICHPSLANDNCSGVALLSHLAKRIAGVRTRYSYRFLFAPGTIGAITWLARNEQNTRRVKHGLIVSMVGDGGGPTYKKSRRGDAAIDRAMIHTLRYSGLIPTILEFSPYGYDERQYCSPGINLPVGCFMRTPHGEFPEYHSSADDLSCVRPEYLEQSLNVLLGILDIADRDARWLNLNPMCEPQLGRRGLYRTTGGSEPGVADLARLWVLNFSDGAHSLLDIAERSGIPFSAIATAARELSHARLLQPADSYERES